MSEFVQYEDKTYYFDSTGAMLTDTEITIDDVTYVIDAVGVVSVKTEIPLRIVNQPFNIEGVNGETIEFHVNAEGAESYRWYYSADGSKWSALGSNYAGNTEATLQVVVSDFRKTLQYRCTVSDAKGNTITSESVRIIEPADALKIVSQPVNAEGEIGETVEFHVEATGAENYRWYYSEDGTTWKAVGNNYIGYNTDTIYVSVTAYRKTLQYRCLLKATDGSSVTSNTVKIVNP